MKVWSIKGFLYFRQNKVVFLGVFWCICWIRREKRFFYVNEDVYLRQVIKHVTNRANRKFKFQLKDV